MPTRRRCPIGHNRDVASTLALQMAEIAPERVRKLYGWLRTYQSTSGPDEPASLELLAYLTSMFELGPAEKTAASEIADTVCLTVDHVRHILRSGKADSWPSRP
jgi:hypothetical protein